MSARFILVAIAFGTPTLASAQPLTIGDRARVMVAEEQRQSETPALRAQLLRGSVTRVGRDTIYLKPGGGIGEIAISFAAIRRVDRSLGVPSRLASAIGKGLALGLLSSLFAGLGYDDGWRWHSVDSRGEAFLWGGVVGFASGAVLGAIWPTERWKRLHKWAP